MTNSEIQILVNELASLHKITADEMQTILTAMLGNDNGSPILQADVLTLNNVNLSTIAEGSIIGSHTLVTGDILVAQGQTIGTQNGIYKIGLNPGDTARHADYPDLASCANKIIVSKNPDENGNSTYLLKVSGTTLVNEGIANESHFGIMDVSAASNILIYFLAPPVDIRGYDINGKNVYRLPDIKNNIILEQINAANNFLKEVSIPSTLINLTQLILNNNSIMSCIIPNEISSLLVLNLMNNVLENSFDLNRENLNSLMHINLCNNILSSVIMNDSYINLAELDISFNRYLTTFTTYSAWDKLAMFNISNCALSEIIIHPEWVGLVILFVNSNLISELIVPSECILLSSINASYNSLSDFISHSEWENISNLNLIQNELTIVGIHNALVPLSGKIVNIALEGGTNEPIDNWDEDSVDAKDAIVAAGGIVTYNIIRI